MNKKLPIGIQSFDSLRTEGYYYVDKTFYIERLVESGKYYFLCRPRRFGKSLFVNTIKEAFLGKRELFDGLYLERHWDWAKTHPLIHIDFAGGVVESAADLKKWILQQLECNRKNLDLKCLLSDDYRNCFYQLIVEANKTYKQKVVVLIDEYDKPILDRLEEREEALKCREVLKNLYSVLKPLDS